MRERPKSHDFGYNVYPRIFPHQKCLTALSDEPVRINRRER